PGPVLRKLVAGDEVDEAVLLSTCNRVELVVLTREIEAARLRLRSVFRRQLSADGAGPAEADLDNCLYEYQDGDVMRHVLRVASSLDSMVVGEPQILGQAKDAYRAAVECGAAGPILGRLFQHAFATAKRVRSETRIAERPVSVARVAVDLAAQIFESFSEKRALLIGAGEMIELAATHFAAQAPARITVANRTLERAERLARRFNAHAIELKTLAEHLHEHDIVVSCTASSLPILGKGLVERALRARRRRPMFMVDLAVPRDIEQEAGELDDVYLYTIDDLAGIVSANLDARRSALEQAEAIIDTQVGRFMDWMRVREGAPLIRALREQADSARREEVQRAIKSLERGEDPAGVVEALS
ncbi:MAG: glutamyl-tRNA reductase, partial [Myxococcota bacterium]